MSTIIKGDKNMTQSEVINIIKNSKTKYFNVSVGGRIVPMRLEIRKYYSREYIYGASENSFHFEVTYNGYSNWSSVTPMQNKKRVNVGKNL